MKCPKLLEQSVKELFFFFAETEKVLLKIPKNWKHRAEYTCKAKFWTPRRLYVDFTDLVAQW